MSINIHTEIRTLNKSDADEFWQLRLRALKEEPFSFGSSYEESCDTPTKEVEQKLVCSDFSFILGAFAPNLVGFVGFTRQKLSKFKHKGTIWGTYVAPEFRQLGIGRKLIQAAIIEASQLGNIEQLLLTVVTENQPASKLYLSLGFQIYGVEQNSLKVGERLYNEHLMALSLDKNIRADRTDTTKHALGVWSLRSDAEPIGNLLVDRLGGKHFRPWHQTEISAKEQFRAVFSEYSQWILIMAAGIAMRFIDGLMQNKYVDPAIVVLDEGCHNAIALLAGHEGGANKLAYVVANITGATPVITTATECCKPLIVGIGCRKGVTSEQIERCIHKALGERSLSDVRTIATIDLKENEIGLLAFCEEKKIPLRIFKQADVASRNWITKPSEWVRQAIGLDGVCEPCALMSSHRAKLLAPKTTLDGVAVAIAEDVMDTTNG